MSAKTLQAVSKNLLAQYLLDQGFKFETLIRRDLEPKSVFLRRPVT
jgi:hypothetical protein